MEPISAADFRESHLNVSDSTEEAYIDELVTVIRQYIEARYDKAIVTQSIKETFNCWETFDLTISPVASITSIKYYDENNDLQTLASSKYDIDKSRISCRVYFNDLMDYPSFRYKPGAIEVTYVAGDTTPNENIKHFIRQGVARMYYDREAFSEVMNNIELIFPEIRILA